MKIKEEENPYGRIAEPEEEVSKNTLLTGVLLETFMGFLKSHKYVYYGFLHNHWKRIWVPGNHSEIRPGCLSDADELLFERVMPALDRLSPKGYYFGYHPGNGSLFGFWEDPLDREEFDAALSLQGDGDNVFCE